jgi:hypothetical protein
MFAAKVVIYADRGRKHNVLKTSTIMNGLTKMYSISDGAKNLFAAPQSRVDEAKCHAAVFANKLPLCT